MPIQSLYLKCAMYLISMTYTTLNCWYFIINCWYFIINCWIIIHHLTFYLNFKPTISKANDRYIIRSPKYILPSHKESEWIRGLGLGFTNHVATGRLLDVCLCLGCGGVCGKWVGGLDQGLEGWGGVLFSKAHWTGSCRAGYSRYRRLCYYYVYVSCESIFCV